MARATHLSGDVSQSAESTDRKIHKVKGNGPFVGTVKINTDPQFMGRLWVAIPSITGSEPTEDELIPCEYLAPFYGAKSVETTDPTNPNSYKGSQNSYGFWAVPPDIGSRVLVVFAEGKESNAFWIGCIQDAYVNHMVPGIASSDMTGQDAQGTDFSMSKEQEFGTDEVPAGEVNKKTWKVNGDTYEKLNKPVHPFAETLRQQGLIQDQVRGTTSSSARRESPSRVFGMSTPGPIDPTSNVDQLGPRESKQNTQNSRLAGHTFTMDDGDILGNNKLVRLRSGSGHQILLHDTAVTIYIGNATGNAWVELSANGSVDVFSANAISFRSMGDMNFHSDSNINFFSRNEIKMSALSRLVLDGGVIQQHADGDIQLQATGGAITQKAGGPIISFGAGGQQHHAGGQIHLAGAQVHFNSIPPMPSIVSTMKRTAFNDPSGTGTKREMIDDVLPSNKYTTGPIEVTDDGNITMSGMRMTTHEPFQYHFDQVVATVGHVPNVNMNTVGTSEHVAHTNRQSDNLAIRTMQFESDLKAHLSKNNLLNGDVEKIRMVSNEFAQKYTKLYNLKDNGPFSKVNELISTGASINEMVNKSIENITTDSLNLTKGIKIGKDGVLFADGLAKNVKGTVNALKSGDLSSVIKGSTTVSNTLNSIVSSNKVLSRGQALHGNTISGVNVIKNTYKNVVGGQVTGITQISSVVNNVKTAFLGKPTWTPGGMTRVGGFVNTFKSKIGSIGRSIGKRFGF